jgi:hypothetical protein
VTPSTFRRSPRIRLGVDPVDGVVDEAVPVAPPVIFFSLAFTRDQEQIRSSVPSISTRHARLSSAPGGP